MLIAYTTNTHKKIFEKHNEQYMYHVNYIFKYWYIKLDNL